jgi:capsular exopolysaccharide synthesis family protein
MSKVFEALKRQRENEKNNGSRDPLAAETGAPDALVGDEDREDANPGFDLPSVIGTPTGPRSNDGMVFASFKEAFAEQQTGETVNGKVNSEALHHDEDGRALNSRPDELTYQGAHRSIEQAPSPSPALRSAQVEVRDDPGEIHNQRSRVKKTKAGTSGAVSGVVSGEVSGEVTEWYPRDIPVEQVSLKSLHPRLILLTDPEAAECEQYRTLRTELFHAAAKRRLQIITVTSAIAGEGKTSTVLNLALAIAQSKEKRVLVIDGDLRRPTIASFLGLRAKVGLVEILNGESDTFSSLFCLAEHDLYVLSVGRESKNPTELLSSERLDLMFTQLREYFDFILVDSPPVMPFADSRLLANHADGVVLVVRSGMAPYETVEKAISSLPQGRVLGVVLNGAEHIKEAGYYDYYYNYARREDKLPLGQRIKRGFRRLLVRKK